MRKMILFQAILAFQVVIVVLAKALRKAKIIKMKEKDLVQDRDNKKNDKFLIMIKFQFVY